MNSRLSLHSRWSVAGGSNEGALSSDMGNPIGVIAQGNRERSCPPSGQFHRIAGAKKCSFCGLACSIPSRYKGSNAERLTTRCRKPDAEYSPMRWLGSFPVMKITLLVILTAVVVWMTSGPLDYLVLALN